jgi:hypothetical protein
MDNQDALCLVFQMLDFAELVRAGGVCRAWRACARTDPLTGTHAVDLREFPNLHYPDYDVFLGAWGARVRALSFYDDNQYSCPTHDAFRWRAAARSLVNLRSLSVAVEPDCGHAALPLECRWLPALGTSCRSLRTVRIAVCADVVACTEMRPFLKAASKRLDELVIVQYQDQTGLASTHQHACEAVRLAHRGAGEITKRTASYTVDAPRRHGVAREIHTLSLVAYTRKCYAAAHDAWATDCAMRAT